MSMETHVFFVGALPSVAALQGEIDALGFPFTIDPAVTTLEDRSGFMPMRYAGAETGVEFDVFAGPEVAADAADLGVETPFERVASFRWGGDYTEAVAGMCAAAALLRLTGGIVYDEAEERLLTADEAAAVVRSNLEELRNGEG